RRLAPGDADRLRERALLGLGIQLRIGRAVEGRAVALLLDAQDVGGALRTGEQIPAIVAVEEFSQRLDPADDQDEVILVLQRKHRIDEIVTRALLAQLDLEAIGEEDEEIGREAGRRGPKGPPVWPHRQAGR